MTYIADDTRYDSMAFRRSGRSGVRLSAIALGFWHRFGEGDPMATQRAVMRRAFDLGINHFDLANNYGPPPGSAESRFGELFAQDFTRYRDEIVVTSKAGHLMWPGPFGEWGSRKSVLASLDQSLTRMGLDHVDIFYSHRPDPETPLEETMGALASAVAQGKALYVGVSNYSADETRRAHKILNALGVPLLIHQPRFSMFDRRPERELFPALTELGIGSAVYSPLAQGLLTDRYLRGIPTGSRADIDHFLQRSKISERYLETIRRIASVAADRDQSVAQLALSWVLAHPAVTSAIIGASSVEQLEQNVRAAYDEPLTEQQIAVLDPLAIDGLA